MLTCYFQGKFIRIHFAASGKLASADIETCKWLFLFHTIFFVNDSNSDPDFDLILFNFSGELLGILKYC